MADDRRDGRREGDDVTNSETTRRDFLKTAGLGLGGMIASNRLGDFARAAQIAQSTTTARNSESIRVAHLTDFHIQEPRGATRGVAKCLAHVQSQSRKPDFILNTGDCVMDVLYRDRARAQELWNLWTKALKDECSLPVEHCLGNHDHWGWGKDRSKTTGNERGWGKQWAMDILGLSKPYHAFDRGAWRFIMLDSCQLAPEGIWEARIDDAQFAWLEAELSATKKPVLIASHVPILSPAVFLDRGGIGGTPQAPALAGRRCHLDVKRLGQLFEKHPNVKLCVSGHLHQIDRADYRGVTYVTNPAVCGNWWKGDHLGAFGEMYTMLDLHADGTFEIERVDYGWTPEVAPTTERAGAVND
jgi:3',5'-cyclic AMP phosphodiesterase CpdA